MGDATAASKAVGDHWFLLVALGGSIAGVTMFLRLIMSAVDGRTEEKVKLMLTNGLGEHLEKRIEAGLDRALRNHTMVCPQAPRVESLEERIVTLERADR